MTKKEILKKVIEKAVKNGWELPIPWMDAEALAEEAFGEYPTRSFSTIIFNHDFAKAFWGEEEIIYKVEFKGKIADQVEKWGPILIGEKFPKKATCKLIVWQHHLQQLATAKDRLKYLEGFL